MLNRFCFDENQIFYYGEILIIYNTHIHNIHIEYLIIFITIFPKYREEIESYSTRNIQFPCVKPKENPIYLSGFILECNF